jgi:hypothetical protein
MRASITCPTTGVAVVFEIDTDTAALVKSWRKAIRMPCPKCSEQHTVPFKDAYVAGVLAAFSSGPRSMFTDLPVVAKRGVKQQRA